MAVYLKYLGVLKVLIAHFSQFASAVRPAFEDNTELCPFTNRLTINDLPAEMTPRITGMKYFRRTNESREEVTMNRANSLCRMYGLVAAEILDQDDYNEAIAIVKETGWSFWINVKGKYNPEYGNYNFDFTLTDGHTKIGFHDFGPGVFDDSDIKEFTQFEEGCVVIEPNDAYFPSGVSWAKKVCTKPHDILCQYKKSCYRRSDYLKDPTRPIKRLAVIPISPQQEESGFAISTHQASWPFAKQVCEDAEMQLIWFDSDAEQEEFQRLMNLFTENIVEYHGKTFWTAGRFSQSSTDENNAIYTKLYWWRHNSEYEVSQWDLNTARSGNAENSGGFLKKWGREREAAELEKNEPYDEGLQGTERCVDASFSSTDGAGEYYTSKCDKSLRYFICKNPDVVKQTINRLGSVQQPSFMDYCDGAQYIKTRGKDCNGEVIFAGNEKPDCTCYGGVHALMVDMRCKPRLLVGTGCTVLKAKSSVHWKILPSDIISDNKSWIIVAHSDDHNEIFNWFFVNTQEAMKRQVLGAPTFFFSGFTLYRNEREPGDLCFVMNDASTSPNEYYEYRVTDLQSVTMRHYFWDEHCGYDHEQVPIEDMSVHQVNSEKNDCEFKTCSRKEADDDNLQIYIDFPSRMPYECDDGTETCDDIHEIVNEGGDGTQPQQFANAGTLMSFVKAEGDIEDVNDNLNRQLLIHAIEIAFPHSNGPDSSAKSGPQNTWLILDKLFELAKQTCGKMVSENFLAKVLNFFKVAHYGENYEYGEYFTDSETHQILKMLDVCREKAYAMREMDVEVDMCTGKASKLMMEKQTKEVISRFADDAGYQTVFHHHIIEATWDVIDLWNAVCISEFKPSYLLFHHMERGLEMLFTEKLRKLWHFPTVTEEYYQTLLGPDEGIQLLNLDQCVLAAYKGNMRSNRMTRPLKGRNTVVGQMIRNRLEDKKLKEEGVVTVNMHPDTKISTACIKGTSVRCHTKRRKQAVGFMGIMKKG